MAQNDLNVNILANVKGAEQIATLINRVGALEKEMNSLQRANAGVAASTDAVIRNGVRYNNMLDAQSKELRQARQGTQQLGMQFNDFFTSVSSGTSVQQAFAQQLGQVGYAMSMMQGTAGKVGEFLAGPWGGLITLASLALIPLIQGLFGVSEETKKAEKAAKDMDAAIESRVNSEDSLRLALAKTSGEYRKIRMEMQANALVAVNTARVELEARLKVLTGLMQQQAAMEKEVRQAGGARAQAEMGTGQFLQRFQNANATAEAITNVKAQITQLEGLTSKLNAATVNVIQASKGEGKKGGASDRKRAVSETDKLRAAQKAIIDQFEKGKLAPAEFEKQLKAVTEAHREAINPADEYLKKFQEQDQALKAFMTTAESLVQKQLPDWEQKLNNLNEQYAKIVGTTRQTEEATLAYGAAIQAVLLGPIDAQIAKYDEMIAKANGVSESFAATSAAIVQRAMAEGASLEEINARLTVLQQKMGEFKIAERNAEIRKSFESIGMSVNDAFKGMLTGAMSWKDGMKGIINAVINELWRLFVVQQIVGMVSNAIGGAFGFGGGGMPSIAGAAANVSSQLGSNSFFGPSQFANGTVNAPGGMAWVGERGPELVNLPRGSQVIPAHRAQSMGGGGVTINVDARGSADPAAVRAQVQQGIIEAAPSIIAAAEARTVQGLRRPRLGGAIK